jgi:hypothetical protein
LGHTLLGSVLGLKRGEGFDVTVLPFFDKLVGKTLEIWKTTERFRTNHSDGSQSSGELDSLRTTTLWRTTMRYVLTNARPEPVIVDLVQSGLDNYWDDTRIISETSKSERRSADEALWHVSVPANGSTTLTAVFDTRY